jgi:rhamnulokinase
MSGTKRVLAVDFGASGGKCFAGLFGDGGFSMEEVHRFSHEGVTFHIPDAAGRLRERTYWDDTLLYQNIRAGLNAYRLKFGAGLDGIGIDTWGADGALVAADGELIGKVYAYRDHRLDTMVDEVKARIDPARLYAITGIHFQPFNLSNQLLWLMTRRPEWVRPGCTFLPVPSLFYYYLGGVKAVDSSWASVTQLMDAKSRRWSAEILAALGIPEALLPPIVAPGHAVGRLHLPLAEALGVTPAPLIAVGSHDTASAFAAAPVDHPEDALIISSGTWSLVGQLIPEPITSAAAMKHNFSNEGGIGNIRFLKNCMGTWLAQELRRVWRAADGRETPWAELDALTLAAPAFASLVDPDDPGFYNPPNMEEAIAAFCRRTGQAAPATRGACLRCVYESLALKYRLVHEQLAGITGRRAKAVHIVGGGSNNLMLNQFTADACALPVIAGPSEATAVGNIMVQAVGLGLLRSLAEAQPLLRKAFAIREYKPREPGAWAGPYAKFMGLVKG